MGLHCEDGFVAYMLRPMQLADRLKMQWRLFGAHVAAGQFAKQLPSSASSMLKLLCLRACLLDRDGIAY